MATSNNPEPVDETIYYDVDEDEAAWLAARDTEWELCPQCDGLGCDNWDDDKLCTRCMGEGEIPVV